MADLDTHPENLSDKDRIVRYLYAKLLDGEEYVRSKDIADALDLSSKTVGAYLSQLQSDPDTVTVEKWGRSRSTSWRVKRS